MRLRCSLFIRFPLLCFYSIYLLRLAAQPQPTPENLFDLGTFIAEVTVQCRTEQSCFIYEVKSALSTFKTQNSSGNKKLSRALFPDIRL